MSGIDLPRADGTGRAISGLALAVTACLLLAPAGMALLGLGILSNEPDSDTGEQESTAPIVALLTVGRRSFCCAFRPSTCSLGIVSWPVRLLLPRESVRPS